MRPFFSVTYPFRSFGIYSLHIHAHTQEYIECGMLFFECRVMRYERFENSGTYLALRPDSVGVMRSAKDSAAKTPNHSAVECCLHTAEVTGSNPVVPIREKTQ